MAETKVETENAFESETDSELSLEEWASVIRVEDAIRTMRSPYTVIESDRQIYEEVQRAYQSLTEREKRCVGTEYAEKLKAVGAALDPKEPERVVRVTDPEYGAAGDGVTNDRAAIQKAIDDVHAKGGGQVVLDAGKTFLSANLMLRSNVELHFEDGAILLQTAKGEDFVDPLHGFVKRELRYGQYVDSAIEWDACAYYNYPFVYAPENTKNVAVTGNGTIRLTGGNDPRGLMTMQAVALFRVDGYRLSDFTVIGYQAYCIKAVSCKNGLYCNLHIDASESIKGGTDGISLCNSTNIRVTNCNLLTGDDGIYVSSAWQDPREGLYYNNSDPETPSHIEIDHNHVELTWDATKAFCFIVWGAQYPDQKRVEVSDVYVHDNYFQTLGAWTGNWNPETGLFDFNGSTNPMKDIRFENNEIGSIQSNFYTLPVSDMYGFDSMPSVRNGDFEAGSDLYWVTRVVPGSRATAGYASDAVGQTGTGYGTIRDLEKGDVAIYEGISLQAGKTYTLTARVQSGGDPVRLFVRKQADQTLIASQPVSSTDWETVSIEFEVPETGNYQLGLERGEARTGWGRIDDMKLIKGKVPAPDPSLETLLGDLVPEGPGACQLPDVLGMMFTSDVDGTVPRVRMYCVPQMSGIHTVTIWNYKTGTLVAGPFEWDVDAGTEGWIEFELPDPVEIEADVVYALGISTGPNGVYAKGTGQLAEELYSDHLYAPANSALYSGNYNLGTAQMPGVKSQGGGSGPNNYFREVMFKPD